MGASRRCQIVSLPILVGLMVTGVAVGLSAEDKPLPERLLLKDFRPQSVYKVPQTTVPRAKYPVIDMHAHVYAKTPEQVANWVRMMDETGVQKVDRADDGDGPGV